ncbi:sugar ABC transporter ATP-binding protein [Acidisoma cellulosilytica]|uniref:Sugar ABC transporter ATP-binding protein n=1 Tax=Acidisoma cellulosilyticum TaxID=2802395 RepID=A0A964E5L2_9PROT|nr:sugar ABC transporter ATP-binding protein [Acidisoma cellulosilyticum]MCB8882557.1 sugar ABC transporter ATP-binding protein [Acidisoma cellulosilyticum]
MSGAALVELSHVTKRYPGVVALNDVTLTLEAGTITALAGENGAGKSTLIKVLSGAVVPDSGEVTVAGRHLPPDPGQVIRSGVSTIYQELTDVPAMNVLDNVLLARQSSRLGVLEGQANRERARAALERVGLQNIDLKRSAGSLTPAQRQLLEIARCLARDARVLIFDEPTSSLPEGDVETLLDIIRQLRREGLAILYVSHHLDELFAISDTIVVMRDGAVVALKPTGEWDQPALVKAMLARDLQNAYPWVERPLGDVALEIKDLTAPGVRSATITARSGEILGLVGLDGAGRTELMKAMAGATKPTSGSIAVDGRTIRLGNLTHARERGIVYAPEDRKREGLILTASIRDNLVLGLYALISRLGLIMSGRQTGLAEASVRGYGVKADSITQPIGTLSGGNQQKVILARVALAGARVIMLDDPTRGVDVGAKSSIYEHVLNLAGQGAVVLLTSSDTDEVLATCDRVYVLRAGRIVEEVMRADFDRERILTSASLG